jgi:hypothetical protein
MLPSTSYAQIAVPLKSGRQGRNTGFAKQLKDGAMSRGSLKTTATAQATGVQEGAPGVRAGGRVAGGG